MVDIEKLRKLLNLTTSPYNGEALNAIRKANELIKAEKKDWEEILKGRAPEDGLRFRSEVLREIEIESLKNTVNKQKRKISTTEKQLKDAQSQIESLNFYRDQYTKYIKEHIGGPSPVKPKQKPKPKTEPVTGQTQFDEHGNYIPKSKRR